MFDGTKFEAAIKGAMIWQIREEFVDMMFLMKQGSVRLLFNTKPVEPD